MAESSSSFPSPPEILPVFPLTGVLLLPGMALPLHIFEPRYRNMVADAVLEGGHIGMIQPFVPHQDNRPLPGAELESPELYPVGCAGRLARHDKSPDGRYLIELRGAARFRIVEELPPHQGYRRVRADYSGFQADAGEETAAFEPAQLLRAFRTFCEQKGMQVNWDELEALAPVVLVNSLAMSLPFSPAEKQALLEANGAAERARTLTGLLALGTAVDSLAPPGPAKLN